MCRRVRGRSDIRETASWAHLLTDSKTVPVSNLPTNYRAQLYKDKLNTCWSILLIFCYICVFVIVYYEFLVCWLDFLLPVKKEMSNWFTFLYICLAALPTHVMFAYLPISVHSSCGCWWFYSSLVSSFMQKKEVCMHSGWYDEIADSVWLFCPLMFHSNQFTQPEMKF